MLVPQSGQILFDNKNINNYENIWKSKIGYVPQKIYLNNETIKENIAFGQHRDDIDDEKVYQAINKARLNELIENKIENIENLIERKRNKSLRWPNTEIRNRKSDL